MGPLIRIEPMGWLYVKVKREDCEEIIERTILHDDIVERLVYKDKDGNPYYKQADIPFISSRRELHLNTADILMRNPLKNT